MSFYDLSKPEREKLVSKIQAELIDELNLPLSKPGKNSFSRTENYFSDEDTYIRKAAYQSIGKIYFYHDRLRKKVLALLDKLFEDEDEKIRQTVVNAAGEIGISDFKIVEDFFHKGLFDDHHSVRNAVIGSMKKMGEKNPKPVLAFAKKYLHHPDKEVRREICHGIELRGRKYPEEILPLLKELEFDKTARVKNTLVHVLGQIAYKKGCLEKVIAHLKLWENVEVVKEAIDEIIDVHHRYKDFSFYTQEQAKKYISKNF